MYFLGGPIRSIMSQKPAPEHHILLVDTVEIFFAFRIYSGFLLKPKIH